MLPFFKWQYRAGAGAGAKIMEKVEPELEPELEPKLNNFGSATLGIKSFFSIMLKNLKILLKQANMLLQQQTC